MPENDVLNTVEFVLGRLEGKQDTMIHRQIELENKVDKIWSMEQGRLSAAERAISATEAELKAYKALQKGKAHLLKEIFTPIIDIGQAVAIAWLIYHTIQK